MNSVTLQPGDVLYREGDPSDHVYFIESGQVEILRGVGPDEALLAVLGKGDMLGEMGVIRGLPRSTTVVAMTEARLTRVEGPTFLRAFGGADGLGLKLLRMICDRLSANNAALAAPAETDAALRRDVAEIRLLGASPETTAWLGDGGMVIRSLPFEVGRAEGGALRREERRLGLPVTGPAAQLEERHFRIELGADGTLHVRDLESRRGSIVNGRRISEFERFEQAPAAALRLGDNVIVAGGLYSPIRFTLRLRSRAAEAAAGTQAPALSSA